ncbi:putative inorganic phosphate transporter [Calocera cornea HHB12733]|uniref:Putative inorganic phosphate transporter n=1 Tax=Calocera cornea HHB12733 TaxID=1353952 RepID=A0A165FGH9_9BASI|nr:putative inorganic phosphate transporter [Calocera cornea HHB12733]
MSDYPTPGIEKTQETVTLDARRRAALAEVDQAKFSWFHVKAVLVAGVGFFTDAYDIFAISIAATMLGLVYAGNTTLGTNADLGIKVATPVGTLVGQLLFGWLADLLGRKRMYGVELMIIIVATFGQALSAQGDHTAVTITGVIVVWRFIMGVGIGGDYPLSAVITSEFAATRIRGRMMCAVFAMQGFGNFSAAVVATVVTVAYKPYILSSGVQAVDYTWRLLIGLGCVPAVIALYFRLTIPETPRYTMDIERNVLQATEDVEQFLENKPYRADPDAIVQRVQAPRASRRDFVAYFSQWKNMKVLIGTAYSWFALDIAFYGLGFNSSIVLTAIGFGTPAGAANTNEGMYQTLYNVSTGNIILAVGGLIPGYWATFIFVDSWGRKPIQLMGFAVLTCIFCAMGFGFWAMKTSQAAKSAFVWLYCMANFFQNFGPNSTTFIIPGEAFPTRYRSTAHGISAASGKLGAIIAQVGFSQLQNIGGPSYWIGHILEIFAFFMLTGVFSTLLLPETKQQTLEQLSNEDQVGFGGVIVPVKQFENSSA